MNFYYYYYYYFNICTSQCYIMHLHVAQLSVRHAGLRVIEEQI